MSPKIQQHYLTLVSGKKKKKLLFETENKNSRKTFKNYFQKIKRVDEPEPSAQLEPLGWQNSSQTEKKCIFQKLEAG